VRGGRAGGGWWQVPSAAMVTAASQHGLPPGVVQLLPTCMALTMAG
jgi:hypothetical protein